MIKEFAARVKPSGREQGICGFAGTTGLMLMFFVILVPRHSTTDFQVFRICLDGTS